MDAASFLLAAVLQGAGRCADPPPEPAGALGLSVREGVRAFARQRGVVALTLAKGIPDFFHWGVLALYVLYAVRELYLSAATTGLAMIGSVGPVLAGAIAAPVGRRFGTGWTSVLATVLFGGANLVIPLAAGPTWLVVAMVACRQFVDGLGVGYLIIVRATMLQRAVPPRLLGLRTGLLLLGLGGLLAVSWIATTAVRGGVTTRVAVPEGAAR